MGLGDLLREGLHDAKEFFDPDTSVPAGTRPHQIFQWFHTPPGTQSYQKAADVLEPILSSLQSYASYLSKAQESLSAGWTGSAADAAQESFAAIQQAAEKVATNASTFYTQLDAQIVQFNSTKSQVVDASANPPSGPGAADYISMLNPMTLPAGAIGIASADASVSSYQSDAHANQRAYSGYQGPTIEQASALPMSAGTPSTSSSAQPAGQSPTVNPVRLGDIAPPASRPVSGSTGLPVDSDGDTQGSIPATVSQTSPDAAQPGTAESDPGSGATGVSAYLPSAAVSPSPQIGGNGGGSFGGAGYGAGSIGGPGGSIGGSGGVGYVGAGFGGSSGYVDSGRTGSRSGVGRAAADAEEGEAGEEGRAATGTAEPGVAGTGARRQRDAEHKRPAYLKENDPYALFGTDEKTVPPVIGE